MIATLLIIAIALAWLLFETDFLRIRLESTEYQKKQALQSKNKAIETESNTTEPYKPTVFIPLEIPEFTGTLNIICERG